MPLTKFITTPALSAIWSEHGHTKLRAGSFQEAIIYFDWALEVKPKNLAALMGRGVACQQLGRYRDAIADFSTALRVHPSYTAAFAARGETYQRMRLHTKAIDDFNLALELNPDYVYVLVARGEIRRQLGLYSGALTDFNRALKLKPFCTSALVGRGETKHLIGKKQEALDDFMAALKINPQQARALAGCGKIKLQQGRYLEAIDDFEAALKILPNYSYALAGQGEAMLALGFYREAFTSFETALKGDPHNVSLSTWLECTKLLLQQNTHVSSKAVHEHAEVEYDIFSLLNLSELEESTTKNSQPEHGLTTPASGQTFLGRKEPSVKDLNAVECPPLAILSTTSQLHDDQLSGKPDFFSAFLVKRKAETTERTSPSSDVNQGSSRSPAYKKQMIAFQSSVNSPSSAKSTNSRVMLENGFFKSTITMSSAASTKATQTYSTIRLQE